MIKIGYVRPRDATGHDEAARLKAAGCQVVRTEEASRDGAVLASIFDFIGVGDELVITRLDRLATSGRGVLEALDRLEARGASLTVLEPQLSSHGLVGQTLRAVLEATSALDPVGPGPRPAAAAHEIRALQRAGVGPVEIARRLGVSRMTVWRKLKAHEGADA
jgi:DNA invertase Pin-like site-specific DNA recombinase